MSIIRNALTTAVFAAAAVVSISAAPAARAWSSVKVCTLAPVVAQGEAGLRVSESEGHARATEAWRRAALPKIHRRTQIIYGLRAVGMAPPAYEHPTYEAIVLNETLSTWLDLRRDCNVSRYVTQCRMSGTACATVRLNN